MPGLSQKNSPDSAFVRRTLFVLFIAVLLLLAWRLVDVFVLAFGAVIVAVLLRSLADPIRDHTPLNDGLSVAAAALVIVAILAAAGWLFGSTISSQVDALLARLPQTPAELRTELSRLPFGDRLAAQIGEGMDLGERVQRLALSVGGYAMNIFGAAANLLLVVFAGVFFAVSPRKHRDGLLMLFPKGPRALVGEALDAVGRALSRWLLGTLASMTVVGVLTGLGTWAIGLPSPLALGLFAALAAFVPIVGPMVSVVPGVLLALQQGSDMVLWTVLVYLAVQQVESNLFYPLIQGRAVDLPPVLTLFAVLGFGVLLGPLGVMFAMPLAVSCFVLIKMLYVRNALGEETDIPGAGGR